MHSKFTKDLQQVDGADDGPVAAYKVKLAAEPACIKARELRESVALLARALVPLPNPTGGGSARGWVGHRRQRKAVAPSRP